MSSAPQLPPPLGRIFIANRGEVAARIARTCDRLGVEVVFGVSEADADAPYVRGREKVVLGPARATSSYLDRARVVQAARQSRCAGVHPGWGFLAEDPVFAALCQAHGLVFIGPSPGVIHLMGKKTPAKRAMKRAGLSLIPGSDGLVASAEEAKRVADAVGYPVLLKAESGGGGRGMRIAERPDDVAAAFGDASAEAQAAFGDPRLYLEKLVLGGRHVEIQVLADRYGHVIQLGERDCTVQRNHQKLIEESPCPVISDEERERVLQAAVRAAGDIGYVGAGTMEFLLDEAGAMRFLEMNTRLQVEHCVTEMRCGIDLVEQQLRVAAGRRLSLRQEDVKLEGHAIECRINAEDPSEGFRPNPGRIDVWRVPSGPGVRVDTHVESGYVVPPHYDSLLCKVVTHGTDRDAAAERMVQALGELTCEGVKTTAPMHLAILQHEDFRQHRYDNRTIPGWPA